MSSQAEEIVEALWLAYRRDPRQLPERVAARFEAEGEARAVADYVAGMTDRFATAEHHRIVDHAVA